MPVGKTDIRELSCPRESEMGYALENFCELGPVYDVSLSKLAFNSVSLALLGDKNELPLRVEHSVQRTEHSAALLRHSEARVTKAGGHEGLGGALMLIHRA